MLTPIISILTLFSGSYLVVLGKGIAPLYPVPLRKKEEVAYLGLFVCFVGLILLPTLFGFTLGEIKDALEDIWSTGGGVGTG